MLSRILPRVLGRCQRRMISISTDHHCLMLEELGDPTEKVLHKTSPPPADICLDPRQVFLEHIAACINPADVSLINGRYGVSPKLPSILGLEGVVKVREVGPEVQHLKKGDLAVGIDFISNWQNYSVQDSESFVKINPNLKTEAAVQIKVNPPTAYRMIKDFNPEGNNTIIQNGANSAVGVYVIQLAKLWGYKTINIVRRPEVSGALKDLGADVVLTEEEVGKVEVIKPILEKYGRPKLFLDCIGGKNADNCLRTLDAGGISVHYGKMSNRPTSIPVAAHIFKGTMTTGFWMTTWYKSRNSSERRGEVVAMLDEIGGMFVSGKLKPKACTMIGFEERNRAFLEPNNTKYVFSINER